jgi:hypothetical protein
MTQQRKIKCGDCGRLATVFQCQTCHEQNCVYCNATWANEQCVCQVPDYAVFRLRKQIKEAGEEIDRLKKENDLLRSGFKPVPGHGSVISRQRDEKENKNV